ncbi:PAAR domain-containing protein [Psychrobacter alimentarius]
MTGSPRTTHNGIPVARKGDQVMCKKLEMRRD